LTQKCIKLIIKSWLNNGNLPHYLIHGIPEDYLVVRKSLFVDVTVNDKTRYTEVDQAYRHEGHEFLVYWQIRKDDSVTYFECGIHDNQGIDSAAYDYSSGRNINIHDQIHLIMKRFCENYPTKLSKSMDFQFNRNRLPIIVIPDVNPPLQYTCTSAARRAAIYGSLLYNFHRSLGAEEVNHGLHMTIDESLATERVFIKHLYGYIHQMNRMMEWIMKSKLIWPKEGQTGEETKQGREGSGYCCLQNTPLSTRASFMD